MTGKLMIYGATGYTGKLTAETAKAQGLDVVLAGRSAEKVAAIAKRLSLPHRAFGLDDPAVIDGAIADVDAVLHIAGPFSATSKPMADACLRKKKHYLDITGEISVFEALAARDAEARKAGIVLMPGVGFDVVPSDCLAAHMKRRMGDAVFLKISIQGLGGISRGTMKTMIEGIGKGTPVRKNGKIAAMPRPPRGKEDFGAGPVATAGVGWGDVSTAYHTTGIPNIACFFATSPDMERMLSVPGFIQKFMAWGPMQRFLKSRVDRMPEGPNEEVRRTGRSILVGEARNAKGDIVRTRLTTPEGYALTALTALKTAARVMAGDVPVGFKTPGGAFGPDYILSFDGTTREELNAVAA